MMSFISPNINSGGGGGRDQWGVELLMQQGLDVLTLTKRPKTTEE